jgi:hypothetical protein
VAASNSGNTSFSDVYNYYYNSSGTWTSPVYDTYVSTPIWGTFDASLSSSSVGTQNKIAFSVHSSSDAGVTFGPYAAQTPDLDLDTTQYRFVQYKAEFETEFATITPRLNSVVLTAASTGTWTSPTLFLSNTMAASWGLFQTAQTTSGSEAAIAYTIKTATYTGGLATAVAVAVTPGSAITASTGAYVVLTALYTVGVATETAYTDSITINWSEGTTAKSATMKVYKNRLHYCGQTTVGTENNICYVMDANGAWVRWTNLPVRHLNVVNQNLVMAGSSATATLGGYVFKLYDTESDNGASLSAYWESKDHFLTKIQNLKAMDRIYVVHKADEATVTTTLKADTGIDSRSYDMNFSTGGAFGIQQRVIDSPINGNSFRLRFGNNAISQPWEVQGYGIMYRDLGLMAP